MNLNELTFAETFKMPVLNPVDGSVLSMSGDKSQMFIEVYSSDTQRYRAAVQEVSADASMTPQQKVSALLAKMTISWKVQTDTTGNPAPFSEKAAFELYEKLQWLREQVENGMRARANFFTGPSTG